MGSTQDESLLTFPYTVDYCDHFETPLEAYSDIVPLIDAIFLADSRLKKDTCGNNENIQRVIKENRSKIRVYDPYYCNGQTGELLRNEFGYQNVVHEKRDFYKDVEMGTVPSHDILITNPPYSDQHKEKCLRYCLQQLRQRKRPFCILMPCYVAAKNYFRQMMIQDTASDIVYLCPSTAYQYQHPEGTGKETSPFESLWFVGLGRHTDIEEIERCRDRIHKDGPRNIPRLVPSWNELRQDPTMSAVFQKRPNPSQRRKRRRTGQNVTHYGGASKGPPSDLPSWEGTKRKKRESKYRDSSGKRTKRRF